MGILFVGTSSEAFVSSSGFNVSTDGFYLDSTYSSVSIVPSGASPAYMLTPEFGPITTGVWVHFFMYNSYPLDAPVVTLFDSGGVPLFRITGVGDANIRAQYWNGSSWQNVGSTFSLTAYQKYNYDLYVEFGASSNFELYRENVSILSGAMNDATVDEVARVGFSSGSTSSTICRFSEIVVADQQTTGWRVFHRNPTGNGNYTTWAGSYTDVDEDGFSDSDFISGTTNDEKESFTTGSRSIGALEVKAIAVTARALRDVTGPQNLQMMLRNGSTDHFSANVPGLTTLFGPTQAIWEVDPASGSKWSASDAGDASLNFGVRAKT